MTYAYIYIHIIPWTAAIDLQQKKSHIIWIFSSVTKYSSKHLNLIGQVEEIL